MGAVEFGRLIAARQNELIRRDGPRRWSQNKIASRFGELPDGRGLDSTQVRLLKEGKRILDHALVSRLIIVMELNENPEMEAEAWFMAGLQDPTVSLDEYREIVSRRRRSDREIPNGTAPPAAASQGGSLRTGDCTELVRAA